MKTESSTPWKPVPAPPEPLRRARTTVEKAPDAIGLSSSYPCAASTGLEPRRDVAAPLLYAALSLIHERGACLFASGLSRRRVLLLRAR